MKEFLITYWYLILLTFLGGVVLALFSQNLVKQGWKNFSTRARLIKRYWMFVVPFILIAITLYVLVIKFSVQQNLGNNLNILGQTLTLIFAIFIGYFAFQQVVENRFEKLREQGHSYFKQQSYLRAIQYYDEAYSINPKDFSVLAELIELYLVIQDYQKFDEKIAQLEKLIIEDYEWSTIHYLKISRFLFKQELGSAKTELGNYLKLVVKKPPVLIHFSWDFSDTRRSETYKKMDGESKTIFDNFVSYLEKGLDEVKKKEFENGNYALKVSEEKDKK